MTQRRLRFQRLASLREKQHDEAVAALRSARHVLDGSLRMAEVHAGLAREALGEQRDALTNSDHRSWMMSCISYELESLHVAHLRTECADLKKGLIGAEEIEAIARRELKQTERVLHAIQKVDAATAARVEQKLLDEAARILRSRSSRLASEVATIS